MKPIKTVYLVLIGVILFSILVFTNHRTAKAGEIRSDLNFGGFDTNTLYGLEGVWLCERELGDGGRCERFTVDALDARNWQIGNDQARSIHIFPAKGWRITLCEHVNCTHGIIKRIPNYSGNMAYSKNLSVYGLDRQLSAIKVATKSNCDGSSGIYFYSDSNYRGRCSQFPLPYMGNPALAEYGDLWNWYVGHKQASSIKFVNASHCEVDLFTNYQSSGYLGTVDSSDTYLGSMNDKVASIQIVCDGN